MRDHPDTRGQDHRLGVGNGDEPTGVATQGRMFDQDQVLAPLPPAIAVELEAAERITLFCLATGTRAPGNGARTRSRLIVKGLIKREGLRLIVTELGRAVLSALLASEQ